MHSGQTNTGRKFVQEGVREVEVWKQVRSLCLYHSHVLSAATDAALCDRVTPANTR